MNLDSETKNIHPENQLAVLNGSSASNDKRKIYEESETKNIHPEYQLAVLNGSSVSGKYDNIIY